MKHVVTLYCHRSFMNIRSFALIIFYMLSNASLYATSNPFKETAQMVKEFQKSVKKELKELNSAIVSSELKFLNDEREYDQSDKEGRIFRRTMHENKMLQIKNYTHTHIIQMYTTLTDKMQTTFEKLGEMTEQPIKKPAAQQTQQEKDKIPFLEQVARAATVEGASTAARGFVGSFFK